MERVKIDAFIEELNKLKMSNGMTPTAFDRGEDSVFVSAESGDDAADYWRMRIDPELLDWASKKGFFWEWENPGCIYLCAI